MKKFNSRLKILILIWLAMFVIDLVGVFVLHRPLFCLAIPGGEVVVFVGLGYVFEVFYPLGPIEEADRYIPPAVHAWPFLLIIAILILYLVIQALITKRQTKKTAS